MPKINIKCSRDDCTWWLEGKCSAEEIELRCEKSMYRSGMISCVSWAESRQGKIKRIKDELANETSNLEKCRKEKRMNTAFEQFYEEQIQRLTKELKNAEADVDEQEPAEGELPGSAAAGV